jgi:hypothetical protein
MSKPNIFHYDRCEWCIVVNVNTSKKSHFACKFNQLFTGDAPCNPKDYKYCPSNKEVECKQGKKVVCDLHVLLKQIIK